MDEVEGREQRGKKVRRRGVIERTDKGGNSSGKRETKWKKWRGERRREEEG